MNWGIIGHQWAVDLLKDQIRNNNIRHAYLFTGVDGVGRRTLALRFIQTMNCTNLRDDLEPCLKCSPCKRIENGTHTDTMVVKPQQSNLIVIDQIRELSRFLSLSAYESKFKSALLENFDKANVNASNAFLKTLEEPPTKVLLAITAGTVDALLPTLVSRCEPIKMRPVPVDFLTQELVSRRGIEEEQARLVSHISGGRPGFALSILDDPEKLESRNQWLEDHRKLLEADRVTKFQYAEELAQDGYKLHQVLNTWISIWRDVILVSVKSSVPLANLDWEEEIIRLSRHYKLETAEKAIKSIQNTIDMIAKYVNPRLALEVLLLDLADE